MEVAQFLGPITKNIDEDRPAVRRFAIASHPAVALEPVENAGHGRGVQLGALRNQARAERTVEGDEIEAIEVDVLQIDFRADLAVERAELVAQLAQRLLDRPGQMSATRRFVLFFR